MKRRLWLGITLLLTFSVIAQEATCPELQQTAFDAIHQYCADQPNYDMCYGHPTLSVNYNDNADDSLRFALPGDLIPINSIDWFSTSSEANTWGTARTDVRAYPADSLELVFSNMVIFGNVIVQNNGTENITIPTFDISITIPEGANLRTEPSTNSRVIEPIMQNTLLKASGRLADNSWIRVHTSREEIAWVSTTAVSERYLDYPIVEPDDPTDRLTMSLQAFDFQSGLPDTSCENPPLSGILLKSYPLDDPPLYEVNGVGIELDGAAFLQAHPDFGLLVSVVDGTATLSALDESQTINEGYVSRVFMELSDGEQLIPIEPPGIPLVYDYESLLSLPLDLLDGETPLALDIYTVITPRPISGESPIAGMALDAPCRFTVGETGANIRSQPGPEGSIIAVMGYRESASPIARTIGTDSLPWWQLAEGIWIRLDTTVTGGDCTSVPSIQFEG